MKKLLVRTSTSRSPAGPGSSASTSSSGWRVTGRRSSCLASATTTSWRSIPACAACSSTPATCSSTRPLTTAGSASTRPSRPSCTTRNLVMGANLMEAARLAKVGKVVNIGTACSYPGYLEGDLKEDDLWGGPCHASVVNYGLTKKMLAVQGQAYKKQYGLDSIHLILTNLYGPGDSYNPDRSHVVAALVRKWVEADLAAAPSIEVWGTGKPIREFIYVEDCADAIVLAAEKYNDVRLPLNIGTGIGTSIRELVETINEVTGVQGQDRLEHRQARRRAQEGARRDADEARARRLGAAHEPPRRAGQDHLLVPGQQGPGGREMVNRRPWFRGGPRPVRPMFATNPICTAAGDVAWARRGRRASHSRLGSFGGTIHEPTVRRISVHQPVLLARSRLHGPASGRPGRVAGRAGLRVPRALRPGPIQARRARRCRRTRSTKAFTFTACRPHRWVGAAR